MIKTIHHIRLPEVDSGLRAYPCISANLFIDRNGVLQSTRKQVPQLLIRWHIDAIIGRPLAHWEFGDKPDSQAHTFITSIRRLRTRANRDQSNNNAI